jgi:hypothetical protein
LTDNSTPTIAKSPVQQGAGLTLEPPRELGGSNTKASTTAAVFSGEHAEQRSLKLSENWQATTTNTVSIASRRQAEVA